jgi:23S rRNA (uracil1939-C5)-methyltransferase
LRSGLDDELMAVIQTRDIEPPSLETDFPVSAALLLPDGTAANLIGDNFLLQSVSGREFRVSAGCYFRLNQAAIEFIVETVLAYAALQGSETILELYSGVGTLTAFLATGAKEVVAVESNPDAVADATVNLEEHDNVSMYQSRVEEVVSLLEIRPDIIVVDPPSDGLPVELLDELERMGPAALIYISSDIATLARDGRRLQAKGFHLDRLKPIDMQPQTFHLQTVSLWLSATGEA